MQMRFLFGRILLPVLLASMLQSAAFLYLTLDLATTSHLVVGLLLVAFAGGALAFGAATHIFYNVRRPVEDMEQHVLGFPSTSLRYFRRRGYAELERLHGHLNELLDRTRDDLAQLSLEKELLASLLGGLREGVLCLNRSGVIVYENEALAAELVRPDTVGRPYYEAILQSELLESVHGLLNEPGQKMTESVGARAHLEISQGSRHFRTEAYPVRIGGRPELFLIIVQDRTQEIQTRRLREDFLQNASHELKTPITSIRGYTESILFREDRDPQKNFLEGVLRNVERMERIIEDMVLISSLESRSFPFHPEAVDLRRFMGNIRKLVSGSLKRKNQQLSIQIDLKDAATTIEADPLLLEHLLLNLIVNASRYSPEKAAISVSVRDDGGRVLFSIQDEGPGIPEDLRGKVFERFFRVDKNRSREEGGTGLGLSIVRQITRLHGGRVWVDSGPAESGSIFRVLLPARQSGVVTESGISLAASGR